MIIFTEWLLSLFKGIAKSRGAIVFSLPIGKHFENESEPELDIVIPDTISLYQDSSVGYIVGFIVRSILKHL